MNQSSKAVFSLLTYVYAPVLLPIASTIKWSLTKLLLEVSLTEFDWEVRFIEDISYLLYFVNDRSEFKLPFLCFYVIDFIFYAGKCFLALFELKDKLFIGVNLSGLAFVVLENGIFLYITSIPTEKFY